ncbi:MAG: CmpA/NrtA family ABC transporter substrate-binding protein [Colwellia sp.]|nr:CmpA/NrtA family ABC transporter substrate-binding protein [Colwellia sp.]
MNQKKIETYLPAPEKYHIKLGYMRLSDSAPLILSKELGLFSKYGLTVELNREVSWANIRDKIIAGVFDACQMLAPMPLITTLGATGIRAPIITGLVLSLNGNGITLSPTLWEQISQTTNDGKPHSPQNFFTDSTRPHLGELKKDQQITFATVHQFSTHTLLLRMWLKAGGIDPDRDVKIIVLPPEQMVDSLAQGVIDGFCVGEPWNSIAVDHGIGILATSGFQVWHNAPEKVLGVLESWHTRNPATHLRLRLALMETCQWLADMDNRDEAINIISRKEYLDLPDHYLRPSLTGKISYNRAQGTQEFPNFHVFSKYNAGFPWRSQAEVILRESEPLIGKILEQNKISSLSQQCYRTDLYREAARHLNIPSPNQDYKPQNSH